MHRKEPDERSQVDVETADARAREVEEQLTDDERFSLIISVLGYVPGSSAATRDPRIP